MRKNGWDKPFDALQISTWFAFPILVIGFYVFFIPVLPGGWATGLAIVYALTAVVVAFIAWKCAGIDPIDENVSRSQSSIISVDVAEDQVYCNVCTQYVNKQSRHCRVCDKCVDVFDHHCKWLNNCIGSRNYRHFLAVIWSTFTLTVIQLAIGIYIIVASFKTTEVIDARVASTFGCDHGRNDDGTCLDGLYKFNRVAFRTVIFVYIALLLPISYLILQLIAFHMKLCYENITTYDYIVRERKRQISRNRDRFINNENTNAGRKTWHARLAALFGLQKNTSSQSAGATVIPDRNFCDNERAPEKIVHNAERVVATGGINGLQQSRPQRGFGAQFPSRASVEASLLSPFSRENKTDFGGDFHGVTSPHEVSTMGDNVGSRDKKSIGPNHAARGTPESQ